MQNEVSESRYGLAGLIPIYSKMASWAFCSVCCSWTSSSAIARWPIKAKWSEVCHYFFQKNPRKVITKFNFNKVFQKLKSVVPVSIVVGFRKCGVHWYNPAAIEFQEEDLPLKVESLLIKVVHHLITKMGECPLVTRVKEYSPVIRLVEHRLMKEITNQPVMGLHSGMEIHRME